MNNKEYDSLKEKYIEYVERNIEHNNIFRLDNFVDFLDFELDMMGYDALQIKDIIDDILTTI